MAGKPALFAPDRPHRVTQCGNRKLRVFCTERDYREYLSVMAYAMELSGVEIWAYCLMPNHIHLVLVPHDGEGVARFVRETHRRHGRALRSRKGPAGRLWQEHYEVRALNERRLLAAVRQVETGPVLGQLCDRPTDWLWSSVHAHLAGRDDELVTVDPMLRRVPDWAGYLEEEAAGESLAPDQKASVSDSLELYLDQ